MTAGGEREEKEFPTRLKSDPGWLAHCESVRKYKGLLEKFGPKVYWED